MWIWFAGAFVGLAATIAGMLVAVNTLTATAPPLPNRGPFYLALFDLSQQPMLRYSGSSSGVNWNVVVSSGGQELGSFTVDGQRVGVMKVGGRTFVKPPPGLIGNLPGDLHASQLRGKWLTGDDTLTTELPSGLDTPAQLAKGFQADLKDGSDFPHIGAAPVRYDGTPALAATLRSGKHGKHKDGTLYVTASEPYRVLGARTTGKSGGASAAGALGTTAYGGASAAQAASLVTRADSGGSGQPAFAPLTPSQVDQEYGDLIDQTKTLKSAVDVGITFDFNQNGNLNCTDTSCTVQENVATSTTSSQDAQLSGNVTATMTANVTVNGQPGGGCTQQSSLPINGSGTMSCTDAGVAGPVQEIKNQAQQKANAEAAASPGQEVTVPYTLSFRASVQIEALAEVAATVTKEVNTEQSQQSNADNEEQDAQDCLTSYGGAADPESAILASATAGNAKAHDAAKPKRKPRDCSNLFKGDWFKHIRDRHMKGGAAVDDYSSIFQDYWDEEDIRDLIQDTVEYGSESQNTPDPDTGEPRDGTLYTKTFDYPIGYRQGDPTEKRNTLIVVENPDGTLRTILMEDRD
ncbi:MAG: hypothetical protein J2P25_25570 [Nocardiopsaceae bacterium]|nr:hypothetical protein [Nocardiopsaceae bacterium]